MTEGWISYQVDEVTSGPMARLVGHGAGDTVSTWHCYCARAADREVFRRVASAKSYSFVALLENLFKSSPFQLRPSMLSIDPELPGSGLVLMAAHRQFEGCLVDRFLRDRALDRHDSGDVRTAKELASKCFSLMVHGADHAYPMIVYEPQWHDPYGPDSIQALVVCAYEAACWYILTFEDRSVQDDSNSTVPKRLRVSEVEATLSACDGPYDALGAEPWSDPRVDRYLATLKSLFGKYGRVHGRYLKIAAEDDSLRLVTSASSGTSLIATLLGLPVVRDGLPELKIPPDLSALRAHMMGRYEFEGRMCDLLIRGGVCSPIPAMNVRTACALAAACAAAITAPPFEAVLLAEIEGPWTPAFYDVGRDVTLVLVSKGCTSAYVLWMTDTD